jgi:hypothetical protein
MDNPLIPEETDQVDDVLLEGLTQTERERVIAAHSRMADCDKSFPGSLAIVLCNAARVMAEVFVKNNVVLKNAPELISNACESVNAANRENGGVAHESKEIILKVDEIASNLSDEVKAIETHQVWQHRWMVGFASTCLICAAWATMECRISERVATGIQTDRFALLANAQMLLDAQKLILERGRLNAQILEFHEKWKALQEDWKVQATPELEATRKQLEAEYAILKRKAQDLIIKEEREYGK